MTTTETTDPLSDYAPPEERPPLAAYATFAAVFHGAMAGAVTAAKRSGRDLPEHVDAGDIALIGTASYQLSRLIAKKKVTAFVRAPFTELEGKGGPAELEEHPRGRGLRRALGELLVCPYCLGPVGLGRLPRGPPVRAARDALQRLGPDRACRSRTSSRSRTSAAERPWARALVAEHEELEPEVGLERELAVVGEHLAARVSRTVCLNSCAMASWNVSRTSRTLSPFPLSTSVFSTRVIVSSSTQTRMRSSSM